MALPAVGTAPILPQTFVAPASTLTATYQGICGQRYTGTDVDYGTGAPVTNSVEQRTYVFLQNLSGGTIAPGAALNFVSGGASYTSGAQNCPVGSGIRCFAPGYVNGNQTNTIPNNAFFLAVIAGPTSVASDGSLVPAASDLVVGSTAGQVRASYASGGAGIKYSLAAAGTVLTNTTTQTSMAGYTFAANTLQAGDVITGRALVTMTGFNSTNTLAIVLQVAGATSGSVNIAGPAAYTGSAYDIQVIDFTIVIRTTGASGTFAVTGWEASGGPGAVGTASTATLRPFGFTAADADAAYAIDTTQAQTLAILGTWSVANGSNTARADIFDVSHWSQYGPNSLAGRALAAAASGSSAMFRAQVNCQW